MSDVLFSLLLFDFNKSYFNQVLLGIQHWGHEGYNSMFLSKGNSKCTYNLKWFNIFSMKGQCHVSRNKEMRRKKRLNVKRQHGPSVHFWAITSHAPSCGEYQKSLIFLYNGNPTYYLFIYLLFYN